MVCTIDLIDGVKTIENFKRMQRDQWAEYRGPFRYLYIWDWQAAFSCNGEFLHFIQHAQSQRVHTSEIPSFFTLLPLENTLARGRHVLESPSLS
jgi:hypothetical protein